MIVFAVIDTCNEVDGWRRGQNDEEIYEYLNTFASSHYEQYVGLSK